MLDLVKKLRDLKDLIPAVYYDDLTQIVLAAIGGDWRTVHTLLFEMAAEITSNLLFGAATTAPMAVAPAPDLDAALTQLEQQTVTAAATPEAIDPGTWVIVIGAVVELIKLIREKRKK